MFDFFVKNVNFLSVYKKLLISFFKNNIENIDFNNLCYTNIINRQFYNYRNIICENSVREIIEKLKHTNHSKIKRDTTTFAIFVFFD